MNHDDPSNSLESLLARPIEQRKREYQYRFAQSAVFGLPVIVLQYLGPNLGGVDSDRWVGLLQALLCGWVTYVGAAGMLFEGLILLGQGRLTAEVLVAVAAVGLYLYSAVSILGVAYHGQLLYQPLLFHWVILLIAGWTAWRWWRLSRTLP